MDCPREVASILLEIMYVGILNARVAGWSGDAARAAHEADHIHNLPELISHYSPALLQFYWDVSKSHYLARRTSAAGMPFELLWERLRPHVDAARLGP